MQSELKRIQRELGTTFVYVTHDQEEALAMSDRIAVMNAGRVEQIGSPREIYDHPETPFVADFIGSLNALEMLVAELVGNLAVGRYGDGERIVVAAGADMRAGESVRVAVRPERVRIDPPAVPTPEDGSRLGGRVAEVVYLGMFTQFHVETAAGTILCHRLADESLSAYTVGTAVVLTWPVEQTALLAGPPAAG
jgi:spermidine/putrescine transport system ATP-binding protein